MDPFLQKPDLEAIQSPAPWQHIVRRAAATLMPAMRQ